jgi:hypothetical protein
MVAVAITTTSLKSDFMERCHRPIVSNGQISIPCSEVG